MLETQGLKGLISNTIGFEVDGLKSIGLSEGLLFVIRQSIEPIEHM